VERQTVLFITQALALVRLLLRQQQPAHIFSGMERHLRGLQLPDPPDPLVPLDLLEQMEQMVAPDPQDLLAPPDLLEQTELTVAPDQQDPKVFRVFKALLDPLGLLAQLAELAAPDPPARLAPQDHQERLQLRSIPLAVMFTG
jgi:hypothetical protein